jgi:predicted outer membrane repeat protein
LFFILAPAGGIGGPLTISGLNIANGLDIGQALADGEPGDGSGGGVSINGDGLFVVLSNCCFSGNSVFGGKGSSSDGNGYGGAICAQNCALSVFN